MKTSAVLLVEDDPDDVVFMTQAFTNCGLGGELQVVRDGEEALDYLEGHAGYADRLCHPLPAFILLDLKLPRKSGLEVLLWLRRQPGLKRIPVIVLTSSTQPRDIDCAYDLGANSYLVKPVDWADLQKTADAICAFWVRLNTGPTSVR